MAKPLRPDICVIGAGSGGLTVAAAAASFGVPVVLIERDRMGGDCLNTGCVPSKSLLSAARNAETIRHAADFGLHASVPEIDFKAVNRHVQSVIDAIAPNDSIERFTALGVRVIKGEAQFVDRRTVRVGDVEVRARRFVIATGSSPMIPRIPGIEDVPYLTNETIFERKRPMRRLVVIGGGPIGLEMAQAHRRLGSEVTVLEVGRILSREDDEITAIVRRRLAAEGVDIRERVRIRGVEPWGNTGARIHVDDDGASRTIDATHLLVATGRKPNLEGLGLEAARVRHTPKGIAVNARLRSSNRRIYAIGDVTGRAAFTHAANYHAGLVLRSILFRLRTNVEAAAIPRVTFTEPEIAHVGLSEAEARDARYRPRILRWPYAENDRAQAERKTDGHIKIVADRRGRILGVSIVGANAGEMIAMWALAVSKRMRVGDIANLVFPYPTFSEIGKRAAIAYFSPATRRPAVRRLIRFLRIFG